MKEKLENKINDIIDNILAKNVNEISYYEYKTLSMELSNIKYEESQKESNKRLAELMAATCCTPIRPTSIIEED